MQASIGRGGGLFSAAPDSGRSFPEQVRTRAVLDTGEIRGLPEGTMLVFYKGLDPMLVQMTAYYRRANRKALTEGRAQVEQAIAGRAPQDQPVTGQRERRPMTDDSQPVEGSFEDNPAPASWWNDIRLHRTGTTARGEICDIATGVVLLWKGGNSPAVSWNEPLQLCEHCADQLNAILATRCRPGGRWAGMPRDLAVESAVLHVQRHGDQH